MANSVPVNVCIRLVDTNANIVDFYQRKGAYG